LWGRSPSAPVFGAIGVFYQGTSVAHDTVITHEPLIITQPKIAIGSRIVAAGDVALQGHC